MKKMSVEKSTILEPPKPESNQNSNSYKNRNENEKNANRPAFLNVDFFICLFKAEPSY